eukprot:UN05996
MGSYADTRSINSSVSTGGKTCVSDNEIPPNIPNLSVHSSPTQSEQNIPAIPDLFELSDKIMPQSTVKIPKRNRIKPSTKFKCIPVKKLEDEEIQRSNFWCSIIQSNLDEKVDINPKEVEYRFSRSRKINFTGFWYNASDDKKKRCPFKVDKNIVVNSNGDLEPILFDFRLRDWVCDRSSTLTNGHLDDIVVWNNKDNGKKMVWRPFVVCHAVKQVCLEQYKLRLPELCIHIIQCCVSQRRWQPKRYGMSGVTPDKKKSLFGEERNKEVEILLRNFRLKKLADYYTLRNKIKFLDESTLAREDIIKLASFVPDQEEVDTVQKVEMKSLMTKTDRFFKVMSEIPEILDLVQLWAFKVQFSDELRKCHDILTVLEKTHQSLTHNKSLKLMFAVILKTLNYINYNTKFGDANGFQLSALEDLMKRRGNQESLLFYVILNCHHKHPQSLRFVHELSILHNASKTIENLPEFRVRVDSLRSDFIDWNYFLKIKKISFPSKSCYQCTGAIFSI